MADRMKALVKERAKKGALIKEVLIPEVKPDQVLIRVKEAALCGTDLEIYNWGSWARNRITPPLIFGHEFCGEILDLGREVKGCQVGDYVTAEMHFICGRCHYCHTGQAHICREVEIGGVDVNGAFAEYVAVPARNIWPLPSWMPEKTAAVMDALGNAVYASFKESLTGKRVLITGAGPIGLFSLLIAKKAGASTTLITDLSPYRLRLANRLGADYTLNVNKKQLKDLALDLRAEVLLEMSGNSRAINSGLQFLDKGGTAVLLGIPKERVPLRLAEDIIFKEIKLLGINGRKIFDTWYRMEGLLKSGLEIDKVITHSFQLEDYQEAFELMQSKECGKILLNIK